MADRESTDREALIVHTRDDRDLVQIRDPRVQAVIYEPSPLPAWLSDLAVSVEKGDLQVPRTILPKATRQEICDWLELNIAAPRTDDGVLTALKADVLELVDRLGDLAGGASLFMLRIFTEAPSTHCGYHVDTVPTGAPVWGILRTYNGAGTAYVDPSDVASTRDFYQYLSHRERLEREANRPHVKSDKECQERIQHEIASLDAQPPFLNPAATVHTIPPAAIVAFKQLEVGLHWSHHPKSLAWIHCSPMAGETRLVVNISSPQPLPLALRTGARAKFH